MTDAEKKAKEHKLMQTYVYYEGNKHFFISTFYRHSGIAAHPEAFHYETFAWTLTYNGAHDKWIADNSGASHEEGGIAQHQEVERQLRLYGKFEELREE